jgi:hypothetical protein
MGEQRLGGNPLDGLVKDTRNKQSKEGKSKEEQALSTWTRATFIVRKDLLKKLKNYAYTERKEIKQVVNEVLEVFLKDKKVIDKVS